ncbi:MAG: cache domain-containing protein [Desulfosporosinus sp.]|nr:cache domain-containing protein [Desulfosporosinus sp.]
MIKNSLKYKFVIVVCIICFICLSIVSAVSFSISYNAMLTESTQKMVEAAGKKAEKINGWLNIQGTIVKGMAEDSQLAQLTDTKKIVSFMQQKRVLYPYFLLVYIAYPDKKLIADDWVPPASFDPTVRDWFISAIKGNKLYYAAPYLDANTQQMIITVSNPVKENESIVGVAAADIDVKNLTELVSNTKIGENSYAFLLDNKNNFIVHPNKDFQPTSTEAKNIDTVMNGKLSEIGKHIQDQSYGVFELKDYDGVDKYVVLSKIEANGWTFGITVPKKELEKPLNKLWFGFAISLLISLTIGVIIILFVMNNMLAPIQKLTQIVREFANKKLDARCPVLSSDEIGQLSSSFNEMADTIQDYNRTLEKKVEDRTRELKDKNEEIVESIDYAKRIQLAILPDFKDYFDSLEEHFFVIWRPRDIVGGDFYFSKKIEQNYFMIIADCTGHSVPGALMTMIVNAVLDRIIVEANNKNPADILKQLNVILKETLKQTEKYTSTELWT